jgi:hypothetical protein
MGAKTLVTLVVIASVSTVAFGQPGAQDRRQTQDDWQNQAGAYRDPCQLRPDLAPCKLPHSRLSPSATRSPGAPRPWESVPPPR